MARAPNTMGTLLLCSQEIWNGSRQAMKVLPVIVLLHVTEILLTTTSFNLQTGPSPPYGDPLEEIFATQNGLTTIELESVPGTHLEGHLQKCWIICLSLQQLVQVSTFG